MRENMAMHAIDGMRRARASVTIRSRFAEEELARAVAAGARQYVILGAGLDTFAYRRTDLADRLAVYEVDEPETQRWKRECLAEARLAVPGNVHFVAVDFNEGELEQALVAGGFRRDMPTVFSWLGVVYYLPRPSVLETLRFIAGQAAPCGVVFDFAVPAATVAPCHQSLLREFMDYNRSRTERWQTWYTPEEMRLLLGDCGFSEVIRLDYETIAGRYLSGRSDGLLPSPLVELISAWK
jgi:methyltransferase (TIGR00027 family)